VGVGADAVRADRPALDSMWVAHTLFQAYIQFKCALNISNTYALMIRFLFSNEVLSGFLDSDIYTSYARPIFDGLIFFFDITKAVYIPFGCILYFKHENSNTNMEHFSSDIFWFCIVELFYIQNKHCWPIIHTNIYVSH
jgi:hypothetical protein